MAAWTSFGDVFSDSPDKKFEMWDGLSDVFGSSSKGEAANMEQLMGDSEDTRGFFDKFDKTTRETKQGWGMPVIQGVSNLAGAYLGYQQLQLGKSQLEQNKKIFNLNFANQAQTLNTQLEDRQRSRVASSAGGSSQAESVDSYMSKNTIKTKGI